MRAHQTNTATPQEKPMSPHSWQLLDERTVSPQQTGRATTTHGLVPNVGTGVMGTGVTPAASPSTTVFTAGTAATAAAALEEAFDAAELRVLTTSTPFVLMAADQELRVTPAPASVELSLALLAELRRDLQAELQRTSR